MRVHTASRLLAVITLVLLLTSGALAGTITTFQGQDDGASTTGPFPNSDAAQAAFMTAASAFGTLNTINFENVTPGFYNSFSPAPGVNISVGGTNFGQCFSGVWNCTLGNLYGFNTTPGGNNWFGFPGDTATITFTNPTNSVGFFITGLQTVFTTTVQLTLADGNVLDTKVNVNGGAQYFGFTDTSAIASLSITDIASGSSTDAWGIDDLTYNGSGTRSVPEPASLLLLGTSLLGLGHVIRKKR